MDVNEYQKVTSKIEQLRRAGDKAAGALEQTMAQMLKEFQVASLPEAEKTVKEMNEELDGLTADYDALINEMRRDFPQLFKE